MGTSKKPTRPPKKSSPPKKAAPAKKASAKKPVRPEPKKVDKKAVKVTRPTVAPAKKAVKPPTPAPHAKPMLKKPEEKKVVAVAPKAPEKKNDAGKIKLVGAPPAPVRKKTEPTRPTKVVMPEIKTKTVRKYEPEFTKSVLDQPEQIHMGPTMRYSDSELGEFKDLILKKLDQAKKELAYLQGLITRKDEMGGDETENRYMTMEDGSMSMEREQLAQMASRQINYIDHLEKAMMRIENKTYGICRVTGKLIDKARLKAVPHATLSIEAKQMMNK